jgi:hypothetical protein
VWDGALAGLLPQADRTNQADPIALSISYDEIAAHGAHYDRGRFGIATRDADGRWVNAVDKNFGGTKHFVMAAWNPSYPLGTYGVDMHTKTAWAVVNYDGDFAGARNI